MAEPKQRRRNRPQAHAAAAPEPARRREPRRAAWGLAAVALVAVAAFAHTLAYGFVFDDDSQILRNPWLRGWSHLGSLFTTDVWRFGDPSRVSNYYRPLHMALYMLTHSAAGLRPAGYHAVSVALHALCSVLVACVGWRLTSRLAVGVAGGLLFAVHPIHAESVAWIAAVADLLCAAFYFAALLEHLRRREERPPAASDARAAALFLGALLSKEMAFTFPVAALWADAALGRRPRWRAQGAYAAVFAVYAALRVHALGCFMVPQVALDFDPASRLLSTVALAGKYVLEMFVPHDIRPYYVFVPTRSPLAPELLTGAAALAALGAVTLVFRRRREVLFLGGFCLLTLAPLLSLTYGWESIFQVRYLYIPSLGAALLAAVAGEALWLRLPQARPVRAAWAGGALAAVALGGGIAAIRATTWIWRDNRTFYTEAVRRAPTSMLMHNNLGRHHVAEGDLAGAETCYRRALALFDGAVLKREEHRSKAYEGLGLVAFKRRDLDAARDHFEKAFAASPDSIDALMSLAMVHGARGDFAAAVAHYRRALARNPRSEVLHNNLAGALLGAGEPEAAIAEARRALEIYPRLAEAHLIIGRAALVQGRRDEARASFLRARDVDPNAAPLADRQLRLLDDPSAAPPGP